MSALSPRRLVAIAALLCVSPAASAQCEFDEFGTISNPDEPSCRDARFEFTETAGGAGNIPIGYPVPQPQDSLTPIAGFRRYASLHARHQDLMLTDANLSGQIVGQTLAARDIWAYRVGDPDDVRPDGLPEAAVMVNGTIHAREWQSPEAVTEVLEQLLERDEDDGLGRYLSEHVNVVILPVNNVDGFIQTQRFPSSVAATNLQPRDGRMRRKNLRNPSGGPLVDDDLATSDDQFLGVDLNRNMVHGFGLNNRSSTDPVSLVYRGDSAASEPESQALIAAAALAPADRLRFYTDVHSFTQVFFLQRTGNQRLDAITASLAQRLRAASNNRYRISTAPVGGQIGLTSDFFGIEYQIPSWTLEIEPLDGGQDYGGTGASHSGFILPDAEVPRMRDEIADMLLLAFYRMAGPPTVEALTIARRDEGSVVYEARWETGPSGTSRQLTVSGDDGLEPGATYRLWLAFDKPMRHRNGQGAIANYPGQSATLEPDIVLAIPDSGDGLEVPMTAASVRWLDQPGGAPDGFHRYRDDALTAEFTLPADTTGDTPLAAVLQVVTRDLSEQSLDGDPTTPADFGSGHWTGYENAFGADGDLGGAACAFHPWINTPTGSTAPADRSATCPAAQTAPPPPPPPAPTPAPAPAPGGGGGGSGAGLVLLGVALLLGRRRS